MKKPFEIVNELRNTNSRNEKISIIQSNLNNTEFVSGLYWCLNPFITFGVKKVIEYDETYSIQSDYNSLQYEEFSKNLYDFWNRQCTGNDALNKIKSMMQRSQKNKWNDWYRLILMKDLKCGVDVKSVNKALKNENHSNLIPTFSCQLAEDQKNYQSKMTGKKIVDVKMDGARTLTIVHSNSHGKDNVIQYSRNGKELKNFSHIKEQFKYISKFLKESYVFDGEVMSSSFQDLMRQIHRKEDVDTDDTILYLFDVLPLSEFETGKSQLTQIERIKDLHHLINQVDQNLIPNIKLIDYEIIDVVDSSEGETKLKEINDYALKNDYEGIMIKDASALYECKRSSNWLKMKPFLTVDLKIIEVLDGIGKYQDTFGSFICEGYENDKFIVVNVGSGFSDEQRNQFWNQRNDLLNRIVEIKADAITKSKNNDFYSLRFPVFMRFRDDKE